MKLRIKDIDPKWKAYALAGCLTVLCFVVLTNLGIIFKEIGNILYVFLPLIIGFAVAYIVNPLAVFLNEKVLKGIKKRKIRWAISAALALVIVFAIIGLLVASLIPQLIENISTLISNAGEYVTNLYKYTENMDEELQTYFNSLVDYVAGDDGILAKMGTVVSDNMSAIIEATSNVGATAVNWLIGVVLAIYFLLAKENIYAAARKLFKLVVAPEKYDRTVELANKFNSIFSKYIICELIDSLIIGGLNYIFMLILGMPNALLISVIVGVTNLIPTFGPVVGAGVGAFILLLLAPKSVIPFLIFTLVIQIADSYIIKPKLFGNALNVPGVLILVAIIVFGRFMGVLGMLIAIPVAAILVYIYDHMFIPWLQIRRKEKNTQTGES